MDILRPQIVRVGNRCYRKNPSGQQRQVNMAEEPDDFDDCTIDRAGWNDESCVLDRQDIEQTSDGYRTTVEAPSELFKFVIGKKGETKQRLENETRTKIKIPMKGREGNIVIQGHDAQGVVSAKNRIGVMINDGRQLSQFTHFLSIPFNTANIQGKFADFKTDVLLSCDGDRGIDGSIFQNPCKLHLTIGTLVLLNAAEIKHATELLQACRGEIAESILKGNSLEMDLTGLEYMNDDPSEVDVLYAKIHDPSNRLQRLADYLMDKFTETGLAQKQYERVKLHVTVMNTLFRKDDSGTTEIRRKHDGYKERQSFNAANVLQKFGSFHFGHRTVDRVHISARHRWDNDGYYWCAGDVNLM